jgi:brefeldin A-resistance guanine nucleotide exchange factor 1
LIASGILPEKFTPAQLAKFFKETPGLSKKLIGEYLAKPDNTDILKAFIEGFDFKGRRIDESLRIMLATFRLPGEAQQISRIIEEFAMWFFHTKPEGIVSQDAAFVLAFSVILLNTDQHNKQVRKPMSLDDFVRNTRGVNDGSDFSRDYLAEIYHAIKENEIIMPEEHEGDVGFQYLWKEMLAKKAINPRNHASLRNAQIGKAMFQMFVAILVNGLTSILDHSEMQRSILLVMDGFYRLVSLSEKYSVSEVSDEIVNTLAKNTKLMNEEGNTKEALLQYIVDNERAKRSLTTLISVATDYSNNIKTSWILVVSILAQLFEINALPSEMLSVEDFVKGSVYIVDVSSNKTTKRDSSLLSTLSQYLTTLSMSDGGKDEEGEVKPVQDRAKNMLKLSGIQNMFNESRFLSEEVLTVLANAIITTSKDVSQFGYKRIPCVVFLLELLVSIVIQNSDRLTLVWNITFGHIKSLIEKHPKSVFLINRCVTSILRIITKLGNKEDSTASIYEGLLYLSKLNRNVVAVIGEALMAGVYRLVKMGGPWLCEEKCYTAVMHLISMTSFHKDASKHSFETALLLMNDSVICTNNFGEIVDLLVGFSTVVGTEESNSKTKTVAPNVERAVQALDKLFQIQFRIPGIVLQQGHGVSAAWSAYWLPVLSGLSQQGYHRNRDIRHTALTLLHRALLLPELEKSLEPPQWADSFDLILFPLLEELGKPEVYQFDPNGISETRIRAVALICKVFLQHVQLLVSWPSYLEIWFHLLDTIEKYYVSGPQMTVRNAYKFDLV